MKIKTNALYLDPKEIYNDAIIGERDGVLVYSIERVIECGIKEYGSYDDSLEWHDYNTFSAYVGEGTPIFENEDEEC